MQLLGVSSLVFLTLQRSVEAVQNAITCTTTADCAWGETCVAGDADTSVQACVPPTVCGGSSMGNCPSDDTGKLACLWRPFNDCSEGCAILNGNKGIYKCVSITRCDAYYGGSSCSDGCSVNGVRCNGQGSCNMMSSSADGAPVFGCTCNNGYSGEKCETAPGSTEAPKTNSSSTDDEDSFWGALDDGSSNDASTDGSDDDNTDDSSTDTSEGASDSATDDSTTDDSSTDADQSSTDASDESSSDNADNDSASSSSSASSSGTVANSEFVSSTTRSGIRPGVLILVLVMTAFFLVGTVLLVAYSRRRKQQEEEEYANALASTQGVGAVGARDLAAGHTGHPMRLLAALLVLVLSPSPIMAMRMAVNCTSTDDCADGETCVAGDSVTSIQACVTGAVCGGSTSGNCPSDATSGQLSCIQRDGIYKCLSIDRCDEYFGGSSCSDGCSVNGVQCNGQGSCNLVSTSSDGAPSFSCSCNEGFSGDKCESGSSTSSGSTTSSSSSKPSSSSSSTESSSSKASSTSTSSSQASSSSTSSSKASSSSSTSASSSSSVSGSSSASSSVSGSSSFSSSVNGSLSSSSSSSISSGSSEAANNNVNPASANSGSVASEADSGGTSSAVFIIIGVLAACIIVGALMFAMYSRKKKREQDAEAGGFGEATAFGATAAAGESELGGGTGADTPKSSIVTM
ncbi:hypothetical protein JG687_00011861 [Phytophthora cactorum]|uniref:EGF-like domain-containing protein n=1 Tax=Phytophthora cactorum TaxID=29920 RepID=A0A8T1U378_9STRA|nr:hypothetical protein JG687_00011861 [Phytophthora cactorum]